MSEEEVERNEEGEEREGRGGEREEESGESCRAAQPQGQSRIRVAPRAFNVQMSIEMKTRVAAAPVLKQKKPLRARVRKYRELV